MSEGLTHLWLPRRTLDVEIEKIFPGLPDVRARFNLQHVDFTQGEDRQRFEERSWNVLRSKDDRCLLHFLGTVRSARKHDEACEVVMIAFDVAFED